MEPTQWSRGRRTPDGMPEAARDVLGRIRHKIRRWQILRRAAAIVAVVVLAAIVMRARSSAEQAIEAWQPWGEVWVTASAMEPGTVIGAEDVIARVAPTVLVPDDAATLSPVGAQVTVAHGRGEIVRNTRLIGRDANTVAALVEPGHSAVTVDVAEDIFAVGDRVALHSLLDGTRLAIAMVVAVHEGAVTVGVDAHQVAVVILELGNGGVVVTLDGPARIQSTPAAKPSAQPSASP